MKFLIDISFKLMIAGFSFPFFPFFLAQTKNRTGANRKNYLTIIDDGTKADFMTKLKPTFDLHGIKPSIAINASFMGAEGYMTWAQIEQLHTEGYEILNHGWTGASPELLTLSEM